MNNKFTTSIPPMSIDEQGMCRGGFIPGDTESVGINKTKNTKGASCVNTNCTNVTNRTSSGCENTNCDNCICKGLTPGTEDGPILQ